MALGSFATATNVSPMPTARAPTPMRRNVADEVPARCPPSEPCASAGPAGAHRDASAARTIAIEDASLLRRLAERAASSPERLLEIHIELEPPPAAAVVPRIAHPRRGGGLVEAAEQPRVVATVAPGEPEAVVRVDLADGPVVEDVRALQAEVEAARADVEPAVELEVDRQLRRRVPRVRQPHRIAGADRDRRVRATRLRLRVHIDADLVQEG